VNSWFCGGPAPPPHPGWGPAQLETHRKIPAGASPCSHMQDLVFINDIGVGFKAVGPRMGTRVIVRGKISAGIFTDLIYTM